ncbi:MAG: triose-phosphate isomerase [Cyclobacteriaceae bacterium]
MRQKIVAGNWKMNLTLDEGMQLASEIVNMFADEVRGEVQAILAPPFTHLSSMAKLTEGSEQIHLSAQNCSDQVSGAYTGEVSAAMLQSLLVSYVIIGHSERRQYFNESDEMLAKKVDRALDHGLIPIFCCGEALEIRENDTQFQYVADQVSASLFHLEADALAKVIIAYEPIWAIGTGKTASAEQAQEMHAHLRSHLAQKYGESLADGIPILYGGSCKPSNAREIFSGADVDGGLIGGASLKSRDFVDIITSF